MTDFRSEPLGDSHRIEDFGSGKEPLDSWLREQSRRAQSAGVARTYVWTRPGSPEVVAYYAVAPTQVARADLPRAALAGGYSAVPSYLLARLALSSALHGQRLGGELLLDALGRIVEAARISGGRLIVVDALDDHAHRFYRRYDFIPVDGSNRLYLKVATAEAILAKSSG
jgi:predicted GNAT family N-acyltransferase